MATSITDSFSPSIIIVCISLFAILLISIGESQDEFDPITDCPCYDEDVRCKIPTPTNCKGSLVDDRCFCCKICGKVENEACEGREKWLGTCSDGFFCLHRENDHLLNYPGVCKNAKSWKVYETTTAGNFDSSISTESSGC